MNKVLTNNKELLEELIPTLDDEIDEEKTRFKAKTRMALPLPIQQELCGKIKEQFPIKSMVKTRYGVGEVEEYKVTNKYGYQVVVRYLDGSHSIPITTALEHIKGHSDKSMTNMVCSGLTDDQRFQLRSKGIL